MSYLSELIKDAEQTDGYMGRKADYYRRREEQLKEKETDLEEGEEKSGFSKFLLLPLATIGGYFLWYYFRRY